MKVTQKNVRCKTIRGIEDEQRLVKQGSSEWKKVDLFDLDKVKGDLEETPLGTEVRRIVHSTEVLNQKSKLVKQNGNQVKTSLRCPVEFAEITHKEGKIDQVHFIEADSRIEIITASDDVFRNIQLVSLKMKVNSLLQEPVIVNTLLYTNRLVQCEGTYCVQGIKATEGRMDIRVHMFAKTLDPEKRNSLKYLKNIDTKKIDIDEGASSAEGKIYFVEMSSIKAQKPKKDVGYGKNSTSTTFGMGFRALKIKVELHRWKIEKYESDGECSSVIPWKK